MGGTSNRVKKSGYTIYKELVNGDTKDDYAMIKEYGISAQTLSRNMQAIKRPMRGTHRMKRPAEEIVNYIGTESEKAGSKCWNASSDVIESLFGIYKAKKSPNPLHGVTPFVLLLPLHVRIHSSEKGKFRPLAWNFICFSMEFYLLPYENLVPLA